MRSQRFKITLAFLVLYLVWGSTYLAIRIGVETLPPAMFAGLRWLIAGIAFAIYARASGQDWPRSAYEWSTIIVVGLCLIVGGNGLVVWGEQWVASNLAALIIASAALWIAGLGTLGRNGEALSRQSKWGLGIGFAGVTILLWPEPHALAHAHTIGELAIGLAAVSWAGGTIYARRRQARTPMMMSMALQSMLGGSVMMFLGLIANEPTRWVWTFAGAAALAYLAILGSLGYVTYAWLMHRTTPAKLGTYAYVNPAIAVLLGWLVLGETLTFRAWIGMGVILVGVVLVTTARALAPRDLRR